MKDQKYRFQIPAHQPESTTVHEMDVQLREQDALLKELRFNLEVVHNRMKQDADAKRRPEEFEIGDLVYLKLQPYRQSSVFKRINQKLPSKFFGPFQIKEHIDLIAYHLELPIESKIHHVFRVLLLR